MKANISLTLLTATGLLLLGSAPQLALAADKEEATEYKLGLALVNRPEYLGSKERRTQLAPLIEIDWHNGFTLGRNGLTYTLEASPQLKYGLSLGASDERKQGRAAALKGMGDISSRPEFGAFVNYALTEGLNLNAAVHYGSGNDRKGLVADLGASYALALAPAWHLNLGAGVSLANARYMQSYYGVNAQQSRDSGYALYTPKAGIRDVHASAMLLHPISPSLTLAALVSASRLTGDASKSPISVRSNEITVGAGFLYSF